MQANLSVCVFGSLIDLFFSKQRRRSAKQSVEASPLSCRCTIVKSQSCDQANAELHFCDILCWGFPVKLQNRWGTGLQGAVMRFVCLLLSWTIGTGLADNLWQLRNSKMSKLRSGEQRALSHTSSDLRTNQELINLRNAGRPGAINTVIFSIELVINFGRNDSACHVIDKSKTSWNWWSQPCQKWFDHKQLIFCVIVCVSGGGDTTPNPTLKLFLAKTQWSINNILVFLEFLFRGCLCGRFAKGGGSMCGYYPWCSCCCCIWFFYRCVVTHDLAA